MDGFELLDRARTQFGLRLDLVAPDQWSLPTPCDEWDVRGLVNHVVGVGACFERLLHGMVRADAIAMIGRDFVGDDPVGAFARSSDAEAAAFREPGALDQTVEHPVFDMPATMLLDFRVGDLLMHAWDLARAIGADETLDPEVVGAVWATMAPLGDALPASGVFGSGASGTLDDQAPLQARLLDLTGRRP